MVVFLLKFDNDNMQWYNDTGDYMNNIHEKFIFRKANIEDVSQIVSVNLETWETTYGSFMETELLQRRVQDRLIMENNYINLIKRYNQIYVIEKSGVIIGYISYGPSEMEGYKNYGEVYAFYILKEYQRHGFGSRLLKLVFDDLSSQGYNHIVITCLWDNIGGINFYKKQGGKIVGHPVYYVYEKTFKDTIIIYNINN